MWGHSGGLHGRHSKGAGTVQGSGPRVSTQALTGDEQDRSKDWKEAFAQHPTVGAEVIALARQAPLQRPRLGLEQAGLAGASEAELQELARCFREYGEKFGFDFLMCAARGKSGEEMLAALKVRMANEPDLELQLAAAEQARPHAARMLVHACGVHDSCIVCFRVCALAAHFVCVLCVYTYSVHGIAGEDHVPPPREARACRVGARS